MRMWCISPRATVIHHFPVSYITRDRLPDESGVDEAQYELEYEGCEYVANSARFL